MVKVGSRGAYVADHQHQALIAGFPVKHVVDTVGAGDCFTGSLLAGFKLYDDIDSAIKFASAAAALKITKVGAQSFSPLKDVLKMMKK